VAPGPVPEHAVGDVFEVEEKHRIRVDVRAAVERRPVTGIAADGPTVVLGARVVPPAGIVEGGGSGVGVRDAPVPRPSIGSVIEPEGLGIEADPAAPVAG